MAERDDGVTRLDQARAKRRAQRQAAAVGEDAIALEFAERHDGHFVFDHTRGEWFRWDNFTWRRDADEYVLDCARALIRNHKLGKIRTATSIERAARTDRRLARDHTAWNADPFLLGTPGDVVDLRTGELLAPDASYMINLSASVRPGAARRRRTRCGRGFSTRRPATTKTCSATCRQRAGYWLTGDTSLEDFDFIYGPGGNGKGVFLKTITAIMGDYALAAPISQFMVSRHDEHLCELARLAHARLVIASEPEENRTWAIGKIKQLTGNEGRIAARHMHQSFFEFWPQLQAGFRRQHQAAHFIRGRGAGAPAQPGAVPVPAGHARRAAQGKADRRIPGDPALGDRRLARSAGQWTSAAGCDRRGHAGISRRRERDRRLARRAVRARAAVRGDAQGAVRRLEDMVPRATAKTPKPTRSSSAGWRSCRTCASHTGCTGSPSKASG